MGGNNVITGKEPPADRMLLNLQMIIDEMDDLFWEYEVHLPGEKPSLRGCLLYSGQTDLCRDILYLLPPWQYTDFPINSYCYAAVSPLHGKAPHICSINQSFPDLLNLVLSVFQRYAEFEMQLNNVITGGGTLTELCRIGSQFFHNPVYIHDDLFSILAVSHRVEGMLQFERNEKTNKQHIPLWLVNEFKFDETYNQTLTLHRAGIWGNDQYPHNIRSLFVNLWDGQRYCGRLLINELSDALQPGHFWAAEYLAGYITTLLRHIEQNQNRHYRSYEEIMIALGTGESVDEEDLHTILSILEWSESDQYLCLKFQPQDPEISIRSDSAMSSALTQILRSYVNFHHDHQLCIVVNLTKSGLDPRSIRQHLAPHVRDALMYAGMSSPVTGIRSICHGFLQTELVLNYISKEDSSSWILSFASCALSYIHKCANQELPSHMLVHPVLLYLLEHDKANGTQYYETLKTYLYCERSIPQTSNALIIHRTTLTYRLSKIQELAKLNLDDPLLRLYLSFSFFMLDRYETSRS